MHEKTGTGLQGPGLTFQFPVGDSVPVLFISLSGTRYIAPNITTEFRLTFSV
jgi:hypothetical protein